MEIGLKIQILLDFVLHQGVILGVPQAVLVLVVVTTLQLTRLLL